MLNAEKEVIFFNTRHLDITKKVYGSSAAKILDISDIRGMNTICSEDALVQLRQRLAYFPREAIYFLGNGNFHYLAYLLLERHEAPLTLVVFDHHIDASPSIFGDLLTCGSWIVKACEDFPNLRHICIIGPKSESCGRIAEQFRPIIQVVTEEELLCGGWTSVLGTFPSPNVYISVDRDFLNKQVVRTNWDQGNHSLDTLVKVLKALADRYTISGADVCGDVDWDYSLETGYPLQQYQAQTCQVNCRIFQAFNESVI